MTTQSLAILVFAISTAFARRPDCQVVKSRLNENEAARGHDSIDGIYSYPKQLEALVNFQIKTEMRAFYTYTSMVQWTRKFDSSFPGFEKFFSNSAAEELKHADQFMMYQAKRGGVVKLLAIDEPPKAAWRTAREVLTDALKLEKNVTDEVLCLHNLAADLKDEDFLNFIESEVIPEQYESMKELATMIETLDRMSTPQLKNNGLAEFHFDRTLQEKNKV